MFPASYWGPGYWGKAYWPPAGPGTVITWANSNALTRVTRGTQLTTAALPPGTWRLLIKAFDTSGNESANAAGVDITVSNENDVVIDQVENPRWLGTLTDLVKHDVSGLLVPDSQNLASADDFGTFDSFVPNPVEEVFYLAPEIDIGFDSAMRIYGELEGVLGPGETGIADPILSIDHRTEAGVYDGFEDWTIGGVTTRHLKARVKIITATGVAALKAARIILDVQERTEGAKSVAIAAGGGTAIAFAEQFHIAPRVDVTADSSTALIATKKNVTTTGFTAQVWNTSGTDVGGTIDWTAEGV